VNRTCVETFKKLLQYDGAGWRTLVYIIMGECGDFYVFLVMRENGGLYSFMIMGRDEAFAYLL
jgi:hypothetical protein